VSRNVFVRAIGEYFSDYTDSLRDDSRTNLPLLVYDGGQKKWVRTWRTPTTRCTGSFLFVQADAGDGVLRRVRREHDGTGGVRVPGDAATERCILREGELFVAPLR